LIRARARLPCNKRTTMAPGQKSEEDKEVPSGPQAVDSALAARKLRQINALKISLFQAVVQHVVILQSEATLVSQLAHGSSTQMARMLGNTAGAVGIMGLFVNQMGGKLSDCIGRRPGLLVGPVGNFIAGMLIFRYPTSKAVVLICRMFRLILTTFSGTVMGQAALSDLLSGKELSVVMSQVGSLAGAAMVLGPILEKTVLALFRNNPRYPYLFQALFAAATFVSNYIFVSETLDPVKMRAASFSISDLNPLKFVKIFTKGSKALQKLVVISTLQTSIEGKNLNDTAEVWKRSHLGWTPSQSSNFVIIYGILCIISGKNLTPWLLKKFSARGFTSFTNATTALGFLLRGSVESSIVFLAAVLPMLPGVNAGNAIALKAISADVAVDDGFGKGEFSGWSNNLRALMSAFSTVFFANYYAWAKKQKIYAGTVFMLGGFLGAILPELMRSVSDEELRSSTNKDAQPATDKKQVKAM